MSETPLPPQEEPESPKPKKRRYSRLKLLMWGLLILLFYRVFSGPLETRRLQSDWIGQSAPDMTLTDLYGTVHTLSELKGKRVFLVFWATSCMPCLQEMPHLARVRETVSEDSLVILALTGDDAGMLRQRKAAEKLGINFPIISYTGQVEQIVPPYRNVNLIPTLMVINSEGVFETIEIGGSSYEELMALAIGEGESSQPNG